MLSAVAFLSVVGRSQPPTERTFRWFPVAGALIGAVVAACWWGSQEVWALPLAAALTVAADLAITGMLHIDGLADSADGLLRAGVPVLLGVGGVAQQQADAIAGADAADAAQVGQSTVDRCEIDLEVARVQDRALRGVERRGEAVGHRVRDRQELAVEGAELPSLVVLHDDELGVLEDTVLLDAAPGQAEGELRADDRELELLQCVGQRPDVVFVTVGEDAPLDVIGPLAQPREVGKDDVDPQHVGVGEHEPAVEEHDAPLDLDGRAVATDLSEPAQERDANRFGSHECGGVLWLREGRWR